MSHGKGIGAKFDAFGWNVIDVADGNDVEQILGALEQAKACKGKPTCLILNTVKAREQPLPSRPAHILRSRLRSSG